MGIPRSHFHVSSGGGRALAGTQTSTTYLYRYKQATKHSAARWSGLLVHGHLSQSDWPPRSKVGHRHPCPSPSTPPSPSSYFTTNVQVLYARPSISLVPYLLCTELDLLRSNLCWYRKPLSPRGGAAATALARPTVPSSPAPEFTAPKRQQTQAQPVCRPYL